ADVRAAAKKEGYTAHAFDDFARMLHHTYQPLDAASAAQLKRLYPAGFAANHTDHYAIASLQVPPAYRTTVLEQLSQVSGITVTDRQQGASRLLEILNSDFNGIALYSSLIVFFALLIGYGRIELALM